MKSIITQLDLVNACTTSFALCIALLSSVGFAQDDRPIFKESTTNLVAVIDSITRADFEAACLNVTRDAAQKRLRIYAIAPDAKAGILGEEGFEIEVIYHSELAVVHKKAAGAYYQHNNHLVLCFAAAQFAAGKKALGLRLVRLLAKADPDMWWSSPTHSALTIHEILTGLEKNDETVKAFLKEESDNWAYKVKIYAR